MGGGAVISIGMLTGGTAAAVYYLDRSAGCAAEYYTGAREAAGRWCGAGAAALELTGPVGGEAGVALGLLLDGRLPDGTRVADPLLRADPRGRLPAAPLVTAVRDKAAGAGVAAGGLFTDAEAAARFAALAARVDATSGRSRPRVSAGELGHLAAAAGIDPHEIYRTGAGADAYAAALRHADGRVDRRRAGLDVTVSAPKSVSLLYGLGDDRVVRQVAQAHERAVAEAFGYLERHTSHGLRGHQGDGQRAIRIGTAGFVAAAFTHRTSRADDPQLHTHLVIANVVRGADGRWSAVDSRAVHRHARTAGSIYQAVLRGELTARLGVGWGPVHRGIAEVAGIPDGLCRAFSTRRQQIEAELDASGGDSRAARQRAAYRTRPGKTHTDEMALRERWTRQALDLGHDPAQLLPHVLDRQACPLPPELAAVADRLLGPAGLTAQATSFDRRDMIQGLTDLLPAGLPTTGAELEALAGLILTRDDVVPLANPAEAGRGARRYTTAELLATERHALDCAAQPTAVHPPEVETVDRLLADGGLSAEQQQAVLALLASPRTADVLIGPAGSGKTATLATAAAAWQQQGSPVLGAALAAVTAQRLQQETAIPASSLTRLLTTADRPDPATGRPAGLPARCVVIVDEASMVGTRQLDRLLTHVTAAGGKCLLVGDPAQLPEIDAGGLFTALARHQAEPARLTGNLRQQHSWERDALTWLRDGTIAPALDLYVDHGRVHVTDTTDRLRRAIAVRYTLHARHTGPYSTVVLASRRADVAELNQAIRRRMRADGRLGPDQLTVPDPDGRPLPLAVGDLVMVARNDYTRGLFNGTRGQLTALDRDRLQLRTEAGQDIDLPAGWAAGRLTHAYALTVHKAQGITVDTCLLHGTGALCQQAGYVALSRGRHTNHLYTTLDTLDPDRCEPSPDHTYQRLDGPDPADVLDALADRLTRAPRHTLATLQQPRTPDLARRRERDRTHDLHHRPPPERGHDRDHGISL